MRSNDKEAAKLLVEKLSNIRKEFGDDFNKLAEIIEYPRTNVWLEGELNPHFRRILVELKILALTGKTLFTV